VKRVISMVAIPPHIPAWFLHNWNILENPSRTKGMPDSETGGGWESSTVRNMAYSPKQTGRTLRNRTSSPNNNQQWNGCRMETPPSVTARYVTVRVNAVSPSRTGVRRVPCVGGCTWGVYPGGCSRCTYTR